MTALFADYTVTGSAVFDNAEQRRNKRTPSTTSCTDEAVSIYQYGLTAEKRPKRQETHSLTLFKAGIVSLWSLSCTK